MTSTPESWDDVGCLRLEVDCISQKVQDIDKGLKISSCMDGTSASEVQKLRDEVAFIHAFLHTQHKEERCQSKVQTGCITIIAFLLALHLLLTNAGSASKLTPASVWETHPDNSKTSEANALLTVSQTNENSKRNDQVLKKTSANDATAKRKKEEDVQAELHLDKESRNKSTEETASRNMHWDDEEAEGDEVGHQKGAMQKPHAAANVVARKKPEVKQTPDPELQSALHLQSSIDTEGFAITTTQDNTLPVTGTFSRGLFWVCFPPSTLNWSVKRYAKVFTEVARRQKLMIYPFCYLDTRLLAIDGATSQREDLGLCDDLKKITFVLEVERKKSNVVPDSKLKLSVPTKIPIQSEFDDCIKALTDSPPGKSGHPGNGAFDIGSWTHIESPAWFRQTFDPDQYIKESSVEEFLNDAFSGKLAELQPTKGDL